MIEPTASAPSHDGGANVDLERIAQAAQAGFKTSEEVAVAFVREAILGGHFRPGAHLNQDRIARALGMSRIPVRVALRQLEAERLVVIHPFRGATVATLTPEEIAEVYDLRVTIECHALGFVADRLDAGTYDRLLPDAQHLDDAGAVDEKWIAARDRLYDALFAASRRDRTITLVAALRTEVAGYIAAHQVHRVHTGHVEFLRLLWDGDAEAATAWHRAHLLAVKELVVGRIRAEAPTAPVASVLD